MSVVVKHNLCHYRLRKVFECFPLVYGRIINLPELIRVNLRLPLTNGQKIKMETGYA